MLAAVTARDPSEIAAWHLLARIEQQAGRTQPAEEAALRILKIDPADPRGPLALAEVRSARMDYRGVVSALEPRVMATDAGDVASGAYAEMASRLADAWLSLKDKGRAVQAIEGAHQRAPKDDRLLFSLAATYEQAGQLDRAEKSFRELIARDPSHAPALNYLGYMLANHNRKLADAVGLITRALAEDPDNPAYLDSLGWAYYRLQQYQLALSPLEKAATAVPESSVIQDHLGRPVRETGALSRCRGGLRPRARRRWRRHHPVRHREEARSRAVEDQDALIRELSLRPSGESRRNTLLLDLDVGGQSGGGVDRPLRVRDHTRLRSAGRTGLTVTRWRSSLAVRHRDLPRRARIPWRAPTLGESRRRRCSVGHAGARC